MGSVVAVRARLAADAKCADGDAACEEEYLPLYEGVADASIEAYHAQNKLYRTFRPSLCAYPRKVDGHGGPNREGARPPTPPLTPHLTAHLSRYRWT